MTTRVKIGCCLAALLAVATACAGGQSGTDGKGSTACPPYTERSIALDEVTTLGSAAEVRAKFEARLAANPEITLLWTLRFGGTTALAIEVVEWGSHATWREDPQHVCDELRVPVTLRLTTADGLLDETMEGEFLNDTWRGGSSVSAVTRTAIGQRISRVFDEPDVTLQSVGAWIGPGYVSDGIMGELDATSDSSNAAVADALHQLARFDSSWRDPVLPYQRPRAFDGLCDAVQPTLPGLTAFASNDALIDALTGHWVMCTGASRNGVEHAGISIAADGTWTHLAEDDGALMQQLGFDHEGTYEVIDTSNINGPNARQLNLERRPQEYSVSSDATTLHLVQHDESGLAPTYDNVYVRTDLSIGAPRIERERGERAGLAACDEGEAFVHLFHAKDELRTALSGAWAICSGGFREGAVEIAFDADGTYRHLDANGDTLATGRYTLEDSSAMFGTKPHGPGIVSVDMLDDDEPPEGSTGAHSMVAPTMSEAPIKLLSYGSSDAYFSDEQPQTVLSALP